LIARTAQKEDNFPSDVGCDSLTEILLDKRQRQVDSCTDTRRRVDLAIADIDRISLNPQMSMTFYEFIDMAPVCRDTSSIKHPRSSKNECAGAYRSHAVDMR
jgi:hypothetical protein